MLDGSVADVKQSAGTRSIALTVGGGARAGIGPVLSDTQLIRKVDDNNNYFELELAPNADAQMLLRRLMETGAPIERFELMQPSLHQIFLQRVGAVGIEPGMSGHG